jgi:hypothetical protein
MKKDNLIVLDDDTNKKTPEEIKRTKKQLLMTKTINLVDEIEKEPIYIPQIYELPYIQEIQISKNSAKKEIWRGSSSKGHRYGFRAINPKLHIDLNRPTPEEIP